MTALCPVPSALLGIASPAGRPGAGVAPDGGSWRASWTSPDGLRREAIAPLGGGDWSHGTRVRPGVEHHEDSNGNAPADGVLAWVDHGRERLALRARRRIPGVRPRFPSAGLLVSRAIGGDWQDLAYADDPPDGEVSAAAACIVGDRLLAVYLVADNGGRVVCRALRISLPIAATAASTWERLPDYPLVPGAAGVIAGVHGDVLIAAGGANFPGSPPWEGGQKKTYDEIFVLQPGEPAWRLVGRLPAPRAYAAVVSVPGGVLAIGGENASGIFNDALLLRWNGRQVVVQAAPALPVPLANPVAARLNGRIYVAGGYQPGPPRASSSHFFRLDLTRTAAGWQRLPSWPGPSRAQGVMAALDGAIYLVSGLEVGIGPDGQSQTNYLADAYRYRPGRAWEKLPDPPWSAVAAPSPCPVTATPARVFVLGGVDGRQAGRLPRDTRVPEDILCFDVARHEWRLWPEPWPEPVVTAPTVPAPGRWIFVSGETMAGKRTPAVQTWQPRA